MGTIVDVEELAAATAKHLRLIGAMKLVTGQRFALAIGLGGAPGTVAEGKVTDVSRKQVSLGWRSGQTARVDPDESISAAAFDRGAKEAAQDLVARLLEVFRAPDR
ncbi:hypothetical protein Y013_25615 (plasmid) [Rhodococcus pyridinivorans SB3094]|uniref:Uncharacterized protein n=2 Tax=Rhodococcus pyridinivorans TaxID=103816 RepID=V9XLJ2_9NOCA|nr:hypothetical protein Y013_25615 [Rhodococcus pyridinivorans SB3094]